MRKMKVERRGRGAGPKEGKPQKLKKKQIVIILEELVTDKSIYRGNIIS